MKSSAVQLSALILALSAGEVLAASNADRALGQWRDYAVNAIKPDFDWAEKKQSAALKPSLLSQSLARAARSSVGQFSYSKVSVSDGFDLGVSRQFVGDRPGLNRDSAKALPELSGAEDLQRDLLAPSFQTSFMGNQIRASVILAEQQFAFWQLGAQDFLTQDPDSAQLAAGRSSNSHGVGFRADLVRELNPVLAVRASAQSRIDMDAFMNYRGVYSEAGDFDVPASVAVGMDWSLGQRNVLSLGAERVYYSGIQPFTSNALPDAFLGLLGDGGSPVFSWQDLNIYSLAWQSQLTPSASVELRYSTSQQPEATSALLNMALEDQFSDTNVALTWSQRFSKNSRLDLSAAYSGAQSFLGNGFFSDADLIGHQLEANLAWTQTF